MKKTIGIILVVCVIGLFGILALGSGEDSNSGGTEESKGTVNVESQNNKLGDYELEILSCRTAKGLDNEEVAIVKYKFTNNNDDAKSFTYAFDDKAYQNGVGLNKAYFVEESANYSSDNQLKDVKKGYSLEVEVAYTLNDKTTDLLIEVGEWISLSDKKITKTFSFN